MPPADPRNHRAWLAYWSTELVHAIADAVAHGGDFRLNYAINCARIAHRRALKARPTFACRNNAEANHERQDCQKVGSMTSKKKSNEVPKKNSRGAKNPVATPAGEGVASTTSAIQPKQEKTNMQLSLKGLDKSGRNAVYTGAAISLRFPVGAFPDKQPPTSIDVAGLAGPKPPKQAMSPEERRAARKAQPKLTLAERVAAAEKRTAGLRAKLEKEGAQQPAL